jgi:hypothetical protein
MLVEREREKRGREKMENVRGGGGGGMVFNRNAWEKREGKDGLFVKFQKKKKKKCFVEQWPEICRVGPPPNLLRKLGCQAFDWRQKTTRFRKQFQFVETAILIFTKIALFSHTAATVRVFRTNVRT